MLPKNIKRKEKKSRKSISVQVKQEIIAKYESGVKTVKLVGEYGLPQSTISTIIQQKDKFKTVSVRDDSTRVFKGRELIAEMEKLLLIRIRERQMKGDSVSGEFICDRAKEIYETLKSQSPQNSGHRFEEFKASRGWFQKFKKRTNIRSVERRGEISSADTERAKNFKSEFLELIEKDGYLPQQVFNVDEMGLFWKKMPRRTCIAKDETALPGQKPMKDMLTLLLGANASGDFKLKPMLVYHTNMPRVFKQKGVNRSELGVYWQSNRKSWVSRTLFQEWAVDVFCPSVQSYLTKNKMELKALLLLDDGSGHDPELESALKVKFPFIRVKYLPVNTSSLLQPMDQQVIANFKRLYTKWVFRKCHEATSGAQAITLKEFWMNNFNILEAVKSIVAAWQEVSVRCLNAAWKPLWPAIQQDVDGFEEEVAVNAEIVSLGESMGLEIDQLDVEDLVASHSRELSVEDLQELDSFIENDSGEEEPEQEGPVKSSDIHKFLEHWAEVKKMMTRHPAIEQTELMVCNFEEKGISYFRNLLNERKRAASQSNLDCLIRKNPRLELQLSHQSSAGSSSTLPSTSATQYPPEVLTCMEGDSPEIFFKLFFASNVH